MSLRALVAVLCAAGAMLVWPSVDRSAAASLLAVSGGVTNGTGGAAVPEKLVVTVQAVDGSGKKTNQSQVETDPGGKFRVEGFDYSSGSRLVVSTDYLGVTYSTFAKVPPEGGEVAADLVVFETSDDDASISVLSDLFTVVDGGDGALEVIQLLAVSNSADRTFIGTPGGSGRHVIRLPVAAGGSGLLPIEGFRVEGSSEIGGGVATGEPLLPGRSSLSYGYRVRIPRSGWPMRREVFYPTDRIDLLIEKGLPVDAPEFEFEEQVTLEGKTYRRYRGGPLGAGTQIDATIGVSAAGNNLWWGLGIGLVVLLLAFLAGAFLNRRKKKTPISPAERESLVDQIARLDEDFEAGLVPEGDYHRKRDRMKADLEAITDRMANAGR